MFTGIITDIGRVKAVSDSAGGRTLQLLTGYDTASMTMGASVCCSGVCLTVSEIGPGWFGAVVSAETLSTTTIADWRVDTPVNLERPLRAGEELGGHIVSGHVDSTADVVSVERDGDSLRLTIKAPESLMPFIAAKGSVVLDGVSLTVNEVETRRFGVNIIPHTRNHTTFGTTGAGDKVNLEIDLLARYVARLFETSEIAKSK